VNERFEELCGRAKLAFTEGDADRSVELYEAAELLADEHGEADLADRAFCYRCSVLIELDRAHGEIPRLKRILLASQDATNRWLAAYSTAVAFDLDDDLERACSYARRALELVPDDPVQRARAANLNATLALRSSRFDEAETWYGDALEAHRGLDGYDLINAAQVKDNLGYVLMCTDRVEQGLVLCEEACSSLEAMKVDYGLYEVLQDLCYGYILADRLDAAQECGERAFELAREHDDALVVKNCLFLLSEIAVRRGDAFRARRHLRDLAAYYPEVAVSEEIIDVFLTTDLTTVVNLRG